MGKQINSLNIRKSTWYENISLKIKKTMPQPVISKRHNYPIRILIN